MSKIETTGNELIDNATAVIAVALRDAAGGGPDQVHYDGAMRLRDEIMAGTRELAAGPRENDVVTQIQRGPEAAMTYDECWNCGNTIVLDPQLGVWRHTLPRPRTVRGGACYAPAPTHKVVR